MRIMSCNIRYINDGDGDNGWAFRKDTCFSVILSRKPDIICFQEMMQVQFEDARKTLSAFDVFGVADTPTSSDPTNAIFFLREKFDLIEGSGFWLSETPHVPGSRSWDSACVRFATGVR